MPAAALQTAPDHDENERAPARRHASPTRTIERMTPSTGSWLRQRLQAWNDAFAKAARGGRAEGLSETGYDILEAVAAHEPCSQTEIVAATSVDRSTTATTVRRLMRMNLLKRRRTKEDARAYAVTITAAGKAALRAARIASGKIRKAQHQQIADTLPE
jgi:DNA-binding MarR family transcriptional regulator